MLASAEQRSWSDAWASLGVVTIAALPLSNAPVLPLLTPAWGKGPWPSLTGRGDRIESCQFPKEAPQMNRPSFRFDPARCDARKWSRPLAWAGLLLVTVLGPTAAAAQIADGNPSQARDNTRLMGTVFAVDGTPLENVQIQVFNDDAPAEMARGRTRPSGNYLVRNMGALYNRGNLMGIVARARFDKEGYEPAVIRMRIRKNEVERAYVVLAPTETEVELPGTCGVVVGRVVNRKGRGIKGASVSLRSAGEVIAEAGPTKKDGEFELKAWNTDGGLEVVVSAAGQELVEAVELVAQTQPDLLLPTEVEIRVE